MKNLRSEAVDKCPGVFFDAECDFNGPRSQKTIKYIKNTIFQKNLIFFSILILFQSVDRFFDFFV